MPVKFDQIISESARVNKKGLGCQITELCESVKKALAILEVSRLQFSVQLIHIGF